MKTLIDQIVRGLQFFSSDRRQGSRVRNESQRAVCNPQTNWLKLSTGPQCNSTAPPILDLLQRPHHPPQCTWRALQTPAPRREQSQGCIVAESALIADGSWRHLGSHGHGGIGCGSRHWDKAVTNPLRRDERIRSDLCLWNGDRYVRCHWENIASGADGTYHKGEGRSGSQ